MAYDYPAIDDDELEGLKPYGAPQFDYAPALPPDGQQSNLGAAPRVGNGSYMPIESAASAVPLSTAMPQVRQPAVRPVAPTASDYSAVEPHGWRKALAILGPSLMAAGGNTRGAQAMGQQLFQAPKERLDTQYQQQMKQYDTEQQQEERERQQADLEKLQQSEISKNEAAARVAGAPKNPWKVIAGVIGKNGELYQENADTGDVRIAPGIAGAQSLHPANPPQPHTIVMGNKTYEHDPATDTWKPIGPAKAGADKSTIMIVPTPNGPQVVAAHPGQTLPAGAQTPGGYSTLSRPTQQERNVGAQAKVAADAIPDVIAEVDRLKDNLGPIAGRWNEFTQGKVGMDNPEFAGLHTDLTMLASAVALAHARGRLPENLREEFDHMMNAPQQTPENIKSVLNHVLPWMKRMGRMGENGEGAGAFAPQEQGGGAEQGGGGEQAKPPSEPAPGMKWQHRTQNGKTEWRQVPAQ